MFTAHQRQARHTYLRRLSHQNPGMADGLTPCSAQDFLDQDTPVRGQRYACVSFVSPEEVLARKDAFVLGRFTSALGADVREMLDKLDAKFQADPDVQQMTHMLRQRYEYLSTDAGMQEEFAAFRALHSSELDELFHSSNGFQTSIRGFKIRGSYETVDEASVRARAIKKKDPRFHVFIAEVGCWCPWSPNPDDIKDAEYAETQLNTLVKKYKEVQEIKDEVYEARKTEMMKRLEQDKDTWLQSTASRLAAARAADPSISDVTVAPEIVSANKEAADDKLEPSAEQATTDNPQVV